MERIKLSPQEKTILRLMQSSKYPPVVKDKDIMPMKKLIYEGLVTCKENEFGGLLVPNFTEKGEIYIYDNSKLKNPNVFQDKDFVLSLTAIVISIIALLCQFIIGN